MKERVLNFLSEALDFVIDCAFEIFIGLLVIGAFVVLIGSISYRIQENDQAELRTEYCYKQGYAEVIESKYEPRYYCFDARRDPGDYRVNGIPIKVWMGDK